MTSTTTAAGASAASSPLAMAETAPKKLLEVAADEGSFAIFCEAVERAGMTEFLDGNGPFTAFIPTDAAFGELPESTLENLFLPENKARLNDLLNGHLIPKRKTVVEFERWDALKTVNGRNVAIRSLDKQVSFGVGKVVLPNIYSSNAVIHGIDRVNLPAN
ncbi:fasciclin domain-containing protein [Lysobacter sp. ISL-52]|nr:fasciclin domain-containing protein [Lysobacter sp. ISL-52]MBT2782445.1 fasciclin domain-containing protein [Lysobacter sp. ISL-52]